MRFEFGKNWRSFSQSSLSNEKVNSARVYFHRLLKPEELKNKKFTDIGFGQGLALFLASESGAIVHGLDIDYYNLEALKHTSKFFADITIPNTKIGSVLDLKIIEDEKRAGDYDIVHSWGVLHHTGEMYKAIENCIRLVKENGYLAISIYNSHWSSPICEIIKWLYNKSPNIIKKVFIFTFLPIIFFAKFLITKSNPLKKERGMDFYHDVIDWVGGYPYEYASAEQIKDFIEKRGFKQIRFFPAHVPTGCNEFVFRRL